MHDALSARLLLNKPRGSGGVAYVSGGGRVSVTSVKVAVLWNKVQAHPHVCVRVLAQTRISADLGREVKPTACRLTAHQRIRRK